MSSTRAEHAARAEAGAGRPVRRVRHQARDAVAVMVFSASTASGVAVTLLLLSHLAR